MKTAQALAEITDGGQFERIVTSVLRYAEPETYGNVSHQGINPQGKTVKAPLDNVGWYQDTNMIVCVAHTTTFKGDLEPKWLRDLNTVIPRKEGHKPTGTDGDVVKAIKVIHKIRETHPNIRARLALAINCEESQDLRVKVETLASKNNIELDIWSVSRLADFLDINPNGQIIRRNHFGVEPIRLSKQLLREIGEKSLSNLNFDAELFIERDFETIHQNTLIVGVSGTGKTTYCINVLNKHLARQKPVLVMTDSTVNQAVSIKEAIDIELRRYANELVPQSGQQALNFCSIDEPLIILVEDINRSSDSARLLRKLIDWSNDDSNFILLCPAWHRLIAGLGYEERKNLEKHFRLEYLESYNKSEANKAIIARAKKEQVNIDELSAANITLQLGYDPLLISLANLVEFHEGSNIIEGYVRNTIQSIATKNDLLCYEVEDAIDEYGLYLFKNKKVQGKSRDLKELSPSSQEVFKQVLNDGRLFRQAMDSQDYAILARHDRLNFYIIAKSIVPHIRDDNFDLLDPYFAEIIGIACVLAELDEQRLYQISTKNSLVAFHCYAFAAKTNPTYLNTAISNVKRWLGVSEHQSKLYRSRLYRSLLVLNDVLHNSVPEILSLYNSSNYNYLFHQVGFKHGNLSDGLRWISTYSFDANMTGEKQIIDYVFNKYGENLVNKTHKLLIDKDTSYGVKHLLLRLIGYTQNTNFANAIRAAWHLIPDNKKDYRIFFWAAARVSDDDPKTLLEPIFDYWENLSDERDEFNSSKRADFAAHGLKWKFRDHIPYNSINFILQEAGNRHSLNFYILYMLSEIDHPDVLEAQAIRLANSRRQGNFMPSTVLDSLRRGSENGKTLSIESKQRLLSISENLDNDEFLRKSAFDLWEMSPHLNDLSILKKITNEDIRYETALMGRAKRQDITSIDELIEKIKSRPRYWWQASRYIWHKKLEELFEERISEIHKESDLDDLWIIDELFEKVEIRKAEKLLVKYWKELSSYSKFIQIALMIATSKLQELVAETLNNKDNLNDIFSYFSITLSLYTMGRKGIYRYEQMKALEPYFEYLEESLLFDLASICLKKNWHDIHQKLSTIIKDEEYRRTVEISITDLEKAYRAETSLDELKASPFLYDWINSQKRLGWSHQKVVDTLFDWFKRYKSEQALKVISKPLRESGKRSDYLNSQSILEDIDSIEHRADFLSTLYFDIYSRSLE